MNKRKIGASNEVIAMDYLKSKGYTILEANYRNRYGEIDIIAIFNHTIVFCEVKYRSNNLCGDPLEAVNYRKQHKIINTAMYYSSIKNISDKVSMRFDVIAIYGNDKIIHIENAFDVS